MNVPANQLPPPQWQNYQRPERRDMYTASYEAYSAPQDHEFADYAKLGMSSLASLGQSVGWLADVSSIPGVEQVGEYVRDLGSNAVDYWNDQLSDPMKISVSKEMVRKSDDGSGFMGYEWGDPDIHTIGATALQGLVGTGAGFLAGAGITRVAQVFANPFGRKVLTSTLDDAAKRLGFSGAGARSSVRSIAKLDPKRLTATEIGAAKKLTLIDTALGVAGFGLGEGAVGGMFTGMSVYENIMSMDHEKLLNNERYRQVFESTDDDMNLLERHQYAADTVAKEASTAAGWQSGLTTALLGAPMGAYFGRILGGAKLSSSIPRALATGAGGEAAQETAQSAAEQYLANINTQPFDPSIDDFEGVLNAAITGLIAGGLLGGAIGPTSVRASKAELGIEAAVAERERKETINEIGGEVREAARRAADAGVPRKPLANIFVAWTSGQIDMEHAMEAIEELTIAKREGREPVAKRPTPPEMDVAEPVEERVIAETGEGGVPLETASTAQGSMNEFIARAEADFRQYGVSDRAMNSVISALKANVSEEAATAYESRYMELVEESVADRLRESADAEQVEPSEPIETTAAQPVEVPDREVEAISGAPELQARLKREPYRGALQASADELVKRGGGMGRLIREEAYEGEFAEKGEKTGEVITRQASENPDWFKAMNEDPDTSMSVEKVQNAVAKALAGESLGVRQQRVVAHILDEIRGQREEGIDYARTELDKARADRAAAREQAGLPEAMDGEQAGEALMEDEYPEDMVAESRVIFELMERATALDISEDTLEGLSTRMQDASDQEFIAELEVLINEQERERGLAPVEEEPESKPPTAATAQVPAEEPQVVQGARRSITAMQGNYERLTAELVAGRKPKKGQTKISKEDEAELVAALKEHTADIEATLNEVRQEQGEDAADDLKRWVAEGLEFEGTPEFQRVWDLLGTPVDTDTAQPGDTIRDEPNMYRHPLDEDRLLVLERDDRVGWLLAVGLQSVTLNDPVGVHYNTVNTNGNRMGTVGTNPGINEASTIEEAEARVRFNDEADNYADTLAREGKLGPENLVPEPGVYPDIPLDDAGQPPDPVNNNPISGQTTPRNRLVCVACGSKKKAGKGPALEQYDGPVFQTIRKKLQGKELGERPQVLILSGKHGVIGPYHTIEQYDERISTEKVDELLERGATNPPTNSKGVVNGMNVLSQLDKSARPVQEVIIQGSGEYLRAFKGLIWQLQQGGAIAPDAVIIQAAGGIGEQRQQVGKFVANETDPDTGALPAYEDTLPARVVWELEEKGRYLPKGKKLTIPQRSALQVAAKMALESEAEDSSFFASDFLGQTIKGSGKRSTGGAITATGSVGVNTITGLIAKNVLQLVSPNANQTYSPHAADARLKLPNVPEVSTETETDRIMARSREQTEREDQRREDAQAAEAATAVRAAREREIAGQLKDEAFEQRRAETAAIKERIANMEGVEGFPQPNRHGVYNEAEAETIEFKSDNKKRPHGVASVSVLRIAPDTWVSSGDFDFSTGSMAGYGGPLSATPGNVFQTRHEAVVAMLDSLQTMVYNYIEQKASPWNENQGKAAQALVDQMQERMDNEAKGISGEAQEQLFSRRRSNDPRFAHLTDEYFQDGNGQPMNMRTLYRNTAVPGSGLMKWTGGTDGATVTMVKQGQDASKPMNWLYHQPKNLEEAVEEQTDLAPAPTAEDLSGQRQRDLQGEIVRRDTARNTGQEEARTEEEGDLFTDKQQQELFSRKGPIRLTEEYEVEETGEIVEVDQDAEILLRQHDKRTDMVKQLRECLRG